MDAFAVGLLLVVLPFLVVTIVVLGTRQKGGKN